MSEKLIFSENKKNGELRYNRSRSNAQFQLEYEIGRMYDVSQSECVVCSSGLGAIDSLLHGLFISTKWKQWNIIHGNELYVDTIRLFKSFDYDYGIFNRIIPIDILDSKQIFNAVSETREGSTILFLESCTNPNGYIFDWELISTLRCMHKRLTIIVDNTWLTSKIFNPLSVGVDYVVSSMTKYYSASGCIAGFVVGKEILKVQDWLRIHGSHVSPNHCEIILDALKTMDQRMSNKDCLTVAISLRKTKKVSHVNYPLLSNHLSNRLVNKYWNKDYYPSVLSFTLSDMNIMQARKWMKLHNNLINYKTSYGGADSRFDPWPVESTEIDSMGNKIKSINIRLAIGYKDSGSLVERLKVYLNSLPN